MPLAWQARLRKRPDNGVKGGVTSIYRDGFKAFLLNDDGSLRSLHGDLDPVRIGDTMVQPGPLVHCENGIHFCHSIGDVFSYYKIGELLARHGERVIFTRVRPLSKPSLDSIEGKAVTNYLYIDSFLEGTYTYTHRVEQEATFSKGLCTSSFIGEKIFYNKDSCCIGFSKIIPNEEGTKTASYTADGLVAHSINNSPSVVIKDKGGKVLQQEWHRQGIRHRGEGPAIVVEGAPDRYFLHGVEVNFEGDYSYFDQEEIKSLKAHFEKKKAAEARRSTLRSSPASSAGARIALEMTPRRRRSTSKIEGKKADTTKRTEVASTKHKISAVSAGKRRSPRFVASEEVKTPRSARLKRRRIVIDSGKAR